MVTKDLDARELILRFEKEYDPFKYQVDGICMWPVFRFLVWENLKANRDKLTKRQTVLKEGTLTRIRSYANVFRELPRLWRLRLTKKTFEIAVITTTNRLRDKTNGGYKNIYFDYFEPGLENALFVYADSKGPAEPSRQPSIFLSNKAALPALVVRSISRPKQIEDVRALYRELTTFLEDNHCGDYLDVPFSVWKRVYVIYLSKRDMLVGLFSAIEPKVFLVDCSYGKEWAVAAAKQSNVPVWEMQHGVPDGNLAYYYDPATAGKYKERLPLPDKILTFGAYFSDRFTRDNIFEPDQMENVGLARLEHHRRTFQYQAPRPGENVRVLITSQWTVADRTAEYLEAAVGQLPPNVVLDIKPHPSETKTHPYRILSDRVTILDKGEEFYRLLATYHIHCSVYSTTLLESLGMGVPTVILGLPGSENVIPVTERSYCKIARTPEEFVAILREAAGKKEYLLDWHTNTCKNRSYLWEPNASENLHRVITDIVKS
jgi:hypothetical protein